MHFGQRLGTFSRQLSEPAVEEFNRQSVKRKQHDRNKRQLHVHRHHNGDGDKNRHHVKPYIHQSDDDEFLRLLDIIDDP